MKTDAKYRRAEEVEEESPCQSVRRPETILVRQAKSWKPNTMFPGTLSSKAGLVLIKALTMTEVQHKTLHKSSSQKNKNKNKNWYVLEFLHNTKMHFACIF
jgi:hypothetical protein